MSAELLIAAMFGLVLGNFATSFLFRIPRGIALNGNVSLQGKKPHCSSCEHQLRFYEYLPLLNWLSTRGSCNYCGVKIPPIYSILEVSSMLFAVVTSYHFGIEMQFIAFTFAGIILFTALGIFYEHGKVYYSLIAASLVCCTIAIIITCLQL